MYPSCSGIFVPLSCLLCWVSGIRTKSHSPSSPRSASPPGFFSKRRLSRRRATANDEERSSLYPSSPPTLQIPAQKCRQPSSFSFPVVSHNVILEESESSDHQWKQVKRCRKITFDLSMTRRSDDLSHL
uniref:Secreted protein n=1 Tax=Caenorhabditis japonica TaxID=281687 RepID=A0A8R1I742_CAEJA